MRITARLVLCTFFLSTVSPAFADSTPEKWGKKAKKGIERRHDAHMDALPDLVVVESGHRYYGRYRDRDLIYFPRGDYKGRGQCEVGIDQYYRPWCRKHQHYGNWDYRDFGFWHRFRDHGGCFVGWYNDRWYCQAHRSYRCNILSQPPYIRGGQYYFQPGGYDIVEESHRIWESQGRPQYVPQEPPATWDYDQPTARQLLVGPHGAKQPDGTAPWCFHHGRSNCVIIEGPLNGRPVQIKGQMEGQDGQNHSYYCPLGGNCRL